METFDSIQLLRHQLLLLLQLNTTLNKLVSLLFVPNLRQRPFLKLFELFVLHLFDFVSQSLNRDVFPDNLLSLTLIEVSVLVRLVLEGLAEFKLRFLD